MSKTYLMGDGKLTEEERLLLQQTKSDEDQLMKDVQLRDQQNEEKKKVVTLEMLLKTRIKPHEDRVLVWPDPVAKVTEGGIIKPDEVVEKERPLMGTVIAVGPKKMEQEKLTNFLLMKLLKCSENVKINTEEWKEIETRVQTADRVECVPGLRVLYGRFAGTQTQDPETKEELLIMRPTDIFANV